MVSGLCASGRVPVRGSGALAASADGGRLGGTPRPTAGSDRSVASPKGRDKRGLSRRSRGDRPTGAFCSAVSSKPPYRLASGWNADFLMRRISAGSSFVKAKHLEPRSLFNVANVKVLPIPMLPIFISDSILSFRCSHTCRKNAGKLFGLAHQIGKLCILDISRLAN